jgi:hypothetical protein
MSEKSAVAPSVSEAASWRPLPEVWAAFAKKHPELYLGTAASTRSRFCDRHGPTLVDAGILIRSGKGHYVKPEPFITAAYALVLGLPLPEAVEVSA